jgi:hypothetical protein
VPRSSSVHAGLAGAGTAAGNHWPVPGVPTVRSDFYDLRWSSHDRRWVLHGGLDIAVDEREWSSGAPVRAIEGGDVWSIATFRGCSAIRVGRFGYGHVLPRPGLQVGESVAAGSVIGTSCGGEWHVHVTEWSTTDGCAPGRAECRINPLRPGGLLRLPDSRAPEIAAIRQGPEGELLARIDDPVGEGFFDGQLAALAVRHRPFRVWVGGQLVFQKLAMREDPERVFYRVGADTRRNIAADKCLVSGRSLPFSCDGTYWLRLGSTERCSSGCWITAEDVEGNRTRAWLTADLALVPPPA